MRIQAVTYKLPIATRRLRVRSVVMALGMIVACSDSGPSEADIKDAVRVRLEEFVPLPLMKPINSEDFVGMQSGRDAVVEEIRIIDTGRVRKSPGSEYWPVKVYVKGGCTTTYSGVNRKFAGEIEYNMSRNSSGEWAVK